MSEAPPEDPTPPEISGDAPPAASTSGELGDGGAPAGEGGEQPEGGAAAGEGAGEGEGAGDGADGTTTPRPEGAQEGGGPELSTPPIPIPVADRAMDWIASNAADEALDVVPDAMRLL